MYAPLIIFRDNAILISEFYQYPGTVMLQQRIVDAGNYLAPAVVNSTPMAVVLHRKNEPLNGPIMSYDFGLRRGPRYLAGSTPAFLQTFLSPAQATLPQRIITRR